LKPARRRPQARTDVLDNVRYYREGGLRINGTESAFKRCSHNELQFYSGTQHLSPLCYLAKTIRLLPCGMVWRLTVDFCPRAAI